MKKVLLWLFISFMTFGSSAVFAQEIIGPIREFFRVDSIEILGNRKVESEAIIEKLSTRAEMMLDNYLLRKDLSRIYEMKYFEEVEAYHKIKDGKNILLFKVKNKLKQKNLIFWIFQLSKTTFSYYKNIMKKKAIF